MKNGLPATAILPPNDAKQRRIHGGHVELPSDVLNRVNSTYMQGSGFFGHPDRLCSLLTSMGFKSNGWNTNAPPRADCDTDTYEIGSGQAGLPSLDPSLMNYRVEGYQRRAEHISLDLSLIDISHR